MIINQLFYMSSKITPDPRLFKYLGHDIKWFDQAFSMVVQEVLTGEVSHVDLEWFNQRKIELVSAECQG